MLARGLWLNITATLALFLWLFKSFKKPVNNKLFDHLENVVFFSNFQYSFRSSRSTVDLLTFVSSRIARAFIYSGIA